MPILPRPDPAQGVFETLLVVAGRPIELEAHLDRLGASLGALFGATVPAAARQLVRAKAAGLALGRLRLTVAPAKAGLACEATAEAVDRALVFPSRGAAMRALPLAGGLGEHKWADRSPLLAGAGEMVPLLTDGEEALEAGWANLFAVRGGMLVTPPADGRILPGIVRAAAIAIAGEAGIEAVECRLDRDELLDADEVFLTGSVRGVVPARSLDGAALSPAGEVSRAVAGGLRRRWRVQPSGDLAAELAAARPLGQPAR